MKKVVALGVASFALVAGGLTSAPQAQAAPRKSTVVSGTVFQDKDRDGKIDRGEARASKRLLVFKNKSTGRRQLVRANSRGVFTTKLAPGTYTMTASRARGETLFSRTVKVTKRKVTVNAPLRAFKVAAPARKVMNSVPASPPKAAPVPLGNTQVLASINAERQSLQRNRLVEDSCLDGEARRLAHMVSTQGEGSLTEAVLPSLKAICGLQSSVNINAHLSYEALGQVSLPPSTEDLMVTGVSRAGAGASGQYVVFILV